MIMYNLSSALLRSTLMLFKMQRRRERERKSYEMCARQKKRRLANVCAGKRVPRLGQFESVDFENTIFCRVEGKGSKREERHAMLHTWNLCVHRHTHVCSLTFCSTNSL